MSLLAFLFNPRQNMSKLNGWQRIWLVITGLLLVFHVVVGYSMLPEFTPTKFDPFKYQRELIEIEKWQTDNKQRCADAGNDVLLASQSNSEFNAKGQAAANAEQALTQAKLDEAKIRLFAIETSGRKYYQEWSKFNNAIEAYQKKLSEQNWIPRPFNAVLMTKPKSLNILKECDVIDRRRFEILEETKTAKQASEVARENLISIFLTTVVSFLCFSLGIYFVGWCICWVRKGFISK